MDHSFEPPTDVEERRLPTPRMMEAFNAVMEAGSVSAAARCLGVSQPAVSRLLKQFEDDLGFPLFHRAQGKLKTGSAACRASACQSLYISVVAVSFKKKNIAK